MRVCAPARRVLGHTGRLVRSTASGYRRGVVRARWFVVGGWIAIAVLLSLFSPSDTGGAGGGDIGNLLPPHSVAAAVELRSLQEFRVPLLAETSVVVHDSNGLSALTRGDVTAWALSFIQASTNGTVPDGPGHIVAAVPIPTFTPDTAVTFLYVSSGTSLAETTSLARQYAAHFHNQTSVQTYVTGVAPSQRRQGYYLQSWLGVFELATLALIAVVVAFAFRSLVAPIAVLFVAGIGYLVTIRLLGLLAAALGFALPDQLQPLIAALLIGVVTDYCVLFFFGFRQQLDRGLATLEATRRTVAADGQIVAIAGITVAAGTAALLVANFQLFRAFGPALSVTVLVGLVVSLSLVPALMAILGKSLFLSWHQGAGPAPAPSGSVRGAGRLVRIVVNRRGAAAATAICVALLLLAALPLTQMKLDLSFTSGLPKDDRVQQGAQVLEGSGIRGVTAPTEVLVEGHGVTAQRDSLRRLQTLISRRPGVAAVLGPAQNPLPDKYGIVYSASGNAARFVVIFDSDPLSGTAIAELRQLSGSVDALAQQAGLTGASVSITGQTAIATELAKITRENLWLTLLAALIVELVILALYLRALVAPLALLACSALGVAAALGISIAVFQWWRGDPGLTFYEPFATAVLLLALGSDYNVFTVGSIWKQTARHPLSAAIAKAMPGTARAIGTAGLILAATFAMVAIIPLETFRQLAFTMACGLLIDTFLVRPVLTPAVLTLLGRAAGWPSLRIRTSHIPWQTLLAEVDAAAQAPATTLRTSDTTAVDVARKVDR